MTYKPKIRNKKCKCKFCDAEFLAADIKSKICDDCKITPALLSACETCGNPVRRGLHYCCRSCATKGTIRPTKGKTYKEIYGDDILSSRVGFQKGQNNVAKKPEVREKIKQGVLNSYKKESLREVRRQQMRNRLRQGTFISWYSSYNNEKKERYQSQFEEKFAILLQQKGIEYEKDFAVICKNEAKEYIRTKLVDFVVADSEHVLKHFIELSGFAYPSWQDDFILKLKDLFKTLEDQSIIIFTYESKLDLLKEKISSINCYDCKVQVKSLEKDLEKFVNDFYEKEYVNGTSNSRDRDRLRTFCNYARVEVQESSRSSG